MITEARMQPIDLHFQEQPIRAVIDEAGDPWFVGKDVCGCLDIANPRDALSRLDEDEKDSVGIPDAIGRLRKTPIVNEPGVYRIAFTSRSEEAKAFKRWLAHEVLPSLRRTGEYRMPFGQDVLPDAMSGTGDVPGSIQVGDIPVDIEVISVSLKKVEAVRRIFGKAAARDVYMKLPLVVPDPDTWRASGSGLALDDTLGLFIDEQIIDQEGAFLPTRMAFSAYRRYCRRAECKPVSLNQFGRRMGESFVGRIRHDAAGKRSRGYADVRLVGVE